MTENAFRMTKLPDGITIVTESLPYVRSATVGIWLGVGSRHEPDELAGASHFIEHMLFKGTKTRTARSLAEEVDAVGGQMNAFTGKEYTCYYTRMVDEHIDLAIDLLADMIVNPVFSEENIERERNVIVEEIGMYQDSAEDLVHDVFFQTLWQGNSIGRPVLGYTDSISGIDRRALLDYFGRTYRAANMIVAAAGNVEHERLTDQVTRLMSKAAAGQMLAEQEPAVARADIQIVNKPIEQVHLCVGVPALPFGHEDAHALNVMSAVVGGGASSRLFQEIREERGLAYSVYSYETGYSDCGSFTVYAGTSPDKASEALALIIDELNKVAREGLSDEEIERGKQQLRGAVMLGLESTNTRMNRLGRWMLNRGKVPTIEEMLASIDGVTVDRVADLAGRILDWSKLACAVVGTVTDEVEQTWRRLRSR